MDLNGTKVGNGAPEVTKEDVKEMIRSFDNEELIEILQDAATSRTDVLAKIRKLAELKDPAGKTIFVGGLARDTTSDTLKIIFSSFGEVEESIVPIRKSTGKGQGHGFVVFRHIDGAQRAIKEHRILIDGNMTECKRDLIQKHQTVITRKIYVGHIPVEMTKGRLSAIFAQFGEIEKGPLGFHNLTGRWQGFNFNCSIVYKFAESAKRSLQEPIFTIDGNHETFCELVVKAPQQLGLGVSVSEFTQGPAPGQNQAPEVPLPPSGAKPGLPNHLDGDPFSEFWSRPFTEFDPEFVPAEFVFSTWCEPIIFMCNIRPTRAICRRLQSICSRKFTRKFMLV